jgi:hypothetical protein
VFSSSSSSSSSSVLRELYLDWVAGGHAIERHRTRPVVLDKLRPDNPVCVHTGFQLKIAVVVSNQIIENYSFKRYLSLRTIDREKLKGFSGGQNTTQGTSGQLPSCLHALMDNVLFFFECFPYVCCPEPVLVK